MKPQLVIQDLDTIGKHNENPEVTHARLLRGASWKRQRVIVLLPSADLIPAKVALTHWNLAFPPNNGVVKMLALGMEVGDAYSTAIEQILANPELSTWEYLLTLEADNCPPSDGVVKLIERMEEYDGTHKDKNGKPLPRLDCIGSLYFTKGEGGVAQIWGDINDSTTNFRPVPPDPNGGLIECCGTGMGMNLWRISMFKDERLKRPWFRTLKGKDGEGLGTQDLVFWGDARKYGYRCGVDCAVKTGHYDFDGRHGGIPDFMW